jgi:uncharacterized protein YgiM (DUF1202 family)
MAYTYNAEVINGTLKLRSSASTSSSVLIKIPSGTSITVTTCSNNSWFKTSYNCYSGYVMAEFVWVRHGPTATVFGGRLRLRRTPNASTTTNMICWLPVDTSVYVLDESSGNFDRVSSSSYGTGWADSDYLYLG